jgi:D-sedoheptulose 7-phosphate isomerase
MVWRPGGEIPVKDAGADRERLKQNIEESARGIAALSEQTETIAVLAEAIVGALRSGGTILTAGNGGSAAEALHMAEELVGRFRTDRRSLPAVCLAADTTALTCIGNDYGFDRVFSRQVEGLGREGDVLVVFSTSGTAGNLRLAVEAARRQGVKTVGVLGRDGGPLAGMTDHEVVVAGTQTERIQEAHQVLVHLVLDVVEAAYS